MAAIAVGLYCLYGVLAAKVDDKGVFSLLMIGCFLLGLGLPAFLGGIASIARPSRIATDEIVVPRAAMLASGWLMIVAAALLTIAPFLAYAAGRPNAMGMAIFVGLGIAFIRTGRKRERAF